MQAIIYIVQERFKEAEELLELILRQNNQNADALYNLAYLREILGDSAKAVALYEQALKLTKEEELKQDIIEALNRLQSDSPLDEQVEGLNYCEIIVKDTSTKIPMEPTDDIFEARQRGLELLLDNNASLVSILVIAYNNLEKYTKTCVESILKYTVDIDYELVLVDNGSSDGTFEYFQAVPHGKKKIIRVTENKGAFYGGLNGMRCMNGKYIVCIPNDVWVTKNWLSNMLNCAESDGRIGLITPASDYVSNLQNVNLGFTNLSEMQEKAAVYNISDPRKWEERLRLATVLTFFRKECLDVIGINDYGFCHDFSDDDITFRVRRAGFKAIFCNDVFVQHAGSVVTGVNHEDKRLLLEKGRAVFQQKYYGVDAWQDVNNFELTMLSMLDLEPKQEAKSPEILGIDIRCGTPILQLKNKLRQAEIFDARLSAFVQDPKYWLDLKTICDGSVHVDRIVSLAEWFGQEKFDFVLLGEPLNTYVDAMKLLSNLLALLSESGHLFIKVRNNYEIRAFLNILGEAGSVDQEIVSHLDINNLNGFLQSHGYQIRMLLPEFLPMEEQTVQFIKGAVENTKIVKNVDEVVKKMCIKDYVLDIVKLRN